jgi:hypothetical protein
MSILKKLFNLLGYEVQIRNLKKQKSSQNVTPSSPENKHNLINDIARQYELNILVETGTYLGGLIYKFKNRFKKLYTVELAEELYINATQKFEPYHHIFPIFGDSGEVLSNLVPKLDEPALFWLDGHYSGGFTAKGELDAPIGKELSAIISAIERGISHVILIDDARLLINETSYTGYPRYGEIIDLIKKRIPNYSVSTEHDVIIIKY